MATWDEHEVLRQALLGSTSALGPATVLALRCSIPSGHGTAVLHRQLLRDTCLGNGFLTEKFSPAEGVNFVQAVPVPLPIGHVYVGSGNEGIRLRPSPWLNPHALVASTEDQACDQFEAYASRRADVLQWLRPLSGQRLVAEAGIGGAHAKVLSKIIHQLSDGTDFSPTLLCPIHLHNDGHLHPGRK